ncbi:hypothetical protein EDB19DRAFT_2044126 [Suillus lakei]|nr:hypothetical protein EDB19DRAFT_2044126 [Suillus lakei]
MIVAVMSTTKKPLWGGALLCTHATGAATFAETTLIRLCPSAPRLISGQRPRDVALAESHIL